MIFSIGRPVELHGTDQCVCIRPIPSPCATLPRSGFPFAFWKIPNASHSRWQKSCCPAPGNKIAQAQRFLKGRETLLYFLPTDGCFLELLASVGRQGHGADTPGLRRQAHSLLRKRQNRPSRRNFVANVPPHDAKHVIINENSPVKESVPCPIASPSVTTT